MYLAITAIIFGLITIIFYFHNPGNKCKPPNSLSERLKTWVIFAIFKWVLPKNKRLLVCDVFAKHPIDIGLVPNETEELIERPRKLANALHASDAIRFTGLDRFGNSLLVHLARKHNRAAEVWIYLKSSSGDEYQHPSHPDALIVNTAVDRFSAGGLTIDVLEPMRKWRITFNGHLRKGIKHEWSQNENDNIIHVKFNLLWVPMLRPYDFKCDYSSNILISAIAKQDWTYDFFQRLRINNDCYDHWGQIFGTLSIGEKEEQEIYLRGIRRRFAGEQMREDCEKFVDIHILTKDGCVLCFNFSQRKYGIKNHSNAYLIWSSNVLLEVDGLEQDIDDILLTANQDTSPCATIRFTTGGRMHTVFIKIENTGMTVYGDNRHTKITIKTIKAMYGDTLGRGYMEIGTSCNKCHMLPAKQSVPALTEINIQPSHNTPNVVCFTDPECRSSLIVGGKCLSLGLLSTMDTDNVDFQVPMGVCVTVTAYWKHLQLNLALQEAIQQLEDVAWKVKESDLKKECERVVNMASDIEISVDLKQDILHELQKVFGQDFLTRKFAIRSSAIGEDSESTSAAGQNSTYLGVVGENNLWKAVCSCWASQFTHIAVEYKRQHGQLINAGMAVAIQEMVAAETAGVLFTRDPVTENPTYLNITANYGLGETVVSATTDPDTITLTRSWDNTLAIKEKLIGKKTMKRFMTDDGSIKDEIITDNSSSQCCIADDDILRIGKIGIRLEKAFGAPRDIEWAVSNAVVYILQARPISSLNMFTDFEIAHDHDHSILTDDDVTTRANLGEVIPGATTPLSQLVNKSFSFISTRFLKSIIPEIEQDPYCSQVIKFSQCNGIFDFSNMLAGNITKDGCNAFAKSLQFSIFGRQVVDKNLEQLIRNRFGEPSSQQSLKMLLFIISTLFRAKDKLNQYSFYKQFKVDVDSANSSCEIYEIVANMYDALIDACSPHMFVTYGNAFYNAILLAVLSAGSDFTPDVYADFAILMACCDEVESANVPRAIQELSVVLKQDPEAANFVKLTPKQALEWLKSHTGEAGIKFSQFLQRHGHRCVRECEFMVTPWGDEPLTVIEILRQIMSNPAGNHTKAYISSSEAMQQMKTKLSFAKKLIIKAILPGSRKFVGYREQSKSLYITVVNRFRQALTKMKVLMVHEGRIPDPNLMYFLNFYELGLLLKTRSPHLITLANRRMKMRPALDILRFPEMIIGIPKPLKESLVHHDTHVECIMKGNLACRGIVKGPARIVRKLEDAVHIKQGDIVITYSTDIGWSPYFPLLVGLVTEIGGITSHGAVIAREYGLPCLIGVTGATDNFFSGDIVLLNATEGTVSRVID